MKKMNKFLKGLSLGIGVISLVGLTNVPVLADSDTSNAFDYSDKPSYMSKEDWDKVNKAAEEKNKNIHTDVLIPAEKEKIPQDGDVMNLNVGWTNSMDGYYYCKDEKRIKVSGGQQINGKRYYFDPTTYVMKDGWLNDGGKWYYFLEPMHLNEKYISPTKGLLGTMQTGWLRDNDKIYYFNQNGVMQTGWVQDNGKWYYFNSDGSMTVDTTIGGYNIGPDGAWVQ